MEKEKTQTENMVQCFENSITGPGLNSLVLLLGGDSRKIMPTLYQAGFGKYLTMRLHVESERLFAVVKLMSDPENPMDQKEAEMKANDIFKKQFEALREVLRTVVGNNEVSQLFDAPNNQE